MLQQAAAALIAAVPVGAGAAGAANADARQLLVQDFMREDGNVLEVDNIVGMLTPLTEDVIKMSVPDDMDLSSIGLVRQFFEEIVQIPRISGEASNDYTKRCLDIVEPLLCQTARSREMDLDTTEECPTCLTTVVHFRGWARHQGCVMQVAVQVNDDDDSNNNDGENNEDDEENNDDEARARNPDPNNADPVLFARIIFHVTHSLWVRSLLQNHLNTQNEQL